jgi:hypothetical protein
MFTPSGEAVVPFPVNVVLWLTWNNEAAADVNCTVPSGNLIPPSFDSIRPATVSAEPGVVVPIPIRPNASSAITELIRNPKLSNFAMRPGVGVSKALKPLIACGDNFLDAFLPGRVPAAVVSETAPSRDTVSREALDD